MIQISPLTSKIIIIAFLPSLIFCFFSRDANAQKIKPKQIKKTKLGEIQKNTSTATVLKPIVRTAVDFKNDVFEILVLINQERAKSGLSQLILDDDVSDIARDYSERMAKENFFAHIDVEGNGILERAKTARLKNWSKIGENLFSVIGEANYNAFAVKNWMKSPTHRQNILNKEWTTTGIGIAKSKDGEIYITQIFIKR